MVYHYAESSLQLLRSALEKHKGWLAVFWATVNVCFLLNIYTILKMIASACMDAKARDCSYGIIAILADIDLSGILVIVHVRKFKHSLPHPRIWQLGIPWNCFTLARVYFMLSSWIICFSLSAIPGVHVPHAIFLLSTNYLLYGTALVAVYLLLPAAICLTTVIYTIDQIFCINAEFRLMGRQGFQQVYRLLVATVAFVGAAGFAARLHLLLLHSKNGQKTQSISTTIMAMASWAIRTCSSEKDAASPDP